MNRRSKFFIPYLLLVFLLFSAKADKTIISGGNEYILHDDGTVTFIRKINDESESVSNDVLFDFEINEYDLITLSHYNGKAKTVVIPKTFNNIWVTNIGKEAFKLNSYLEHVVLPAYLLVIEDSAFYKCRHLLDVIIPDSCMWIDKSAFGDCTHLESVKFPTDLIRICNRAFSECKSLRCLELHNTTLKYIEDYAFEECGSLEAVRLPNTVEWIGNYAFKKCYSLISINLPKSLLEIGSFAFKNCSLLNEVIIPKSVSKIGEGAFDGCLSLTLAVYSNSYGESYAKENGLRYRVIY